MYNTYYHNNDIYNNTAKFDENMYGRAFHIEYYSGCKFIGNSVYNANYDQASGIQFQQKGQSNEVFVMSDCIFSNCRGRLGASVNIVQISSNLKFVNISIINCQNFYIEKVAEIYKNQPRGYFFKIDCWNTGSDVLHTEVDFIDCTFSDLVCNGQSGGGIGMMIRKKFVDNANKYSFKLSFENTTFQHLLHTHYKYGGGAISFANEIDENRYTQLTIKDCIFNNITCSNGGGGAIYYNAPSRQLVVEKCRFKDIGSNNIVGVCIYIKHQLDSMPIEIKDCHFENTSSKGGAIYIDWNPSSDSNISICCCTFYKTNAETNIGHTIIVSKCESNEVTISNCLFNDCGFDQDSISLIIDAKVLNFISNILTFSEKNQSCGCLELKQIQSHNIIGNVFKNVQYAINYALINDTYSLVIDSNTFDNIYSNIGGLIYFQAIKYTDITFRNNTIKNIIQDGNLIKLVFQSKVDFFVIDSCKFIENKYNDLTEQIIIEINLTGSTDQSGFEFIYENCFFENCSNSAKVGAFYQVENSLINNLRVSLHGCMFIGNNAKRDGGAVAIQAYQECEIEDCVFKRNKSDDGSGSISIETNFHYSNNNILIAKCIFEDNQGTKANGIYIINSPKKLVFIINCTFKDCGKNGYIVSLQLDDIQISIENCTYSFSKKLDSLKCVGIQSYTDCISLRGNTFQNFQNAVLYMKCLLNERNVFELIENNFISSSKQSLFYIENSLTMSPIIRGNKFLNIVISDTFLACKLNDAIDSIVFDNNTFEGFKTVSQLGGICLDINHRNKEIPYFLQFNDCYFFNNRNQNSFTNQGVIFCDFNMNNGNIELSIINSHFENNYKNNLGSIIYVNIQNDINIKECNFTHNKSNSMGIIYIKPDYGSIKNEKTISIVDCNFYHNQMNFFHSIYIGKGSTKSINIQKCKFIEEKGGIGVFYNIRDINIEQNHFINSFQEVALAIICINEITKIKVNECIFESCNGSEIDCFEIQVLTKYLIFENNIIKNNKGKGYQNYFGLIDFNNNTEYFEFKNNTFDSNECNSLYGGGIGLKIAGIQHLTFNGCIFNNNSAIQDKSKSRPVQESNKPYYNGDGGCIQIGYILDFNNFYISFLNCYFKNNKAQRHGGAIAIQTIYDVSITSCIFENNIANYMKSENLLNYYDKKTEGRGGAIYINPTQSYDEEAAVFKSPINNSTTIQIEECRFIKNTAFDGYAFYIEGDSEIQNVVCEINENRFIDNYNENNYNNNDKNNIYGAVIATEIFSINEKKLINDNNFRYTNKNIQVNELAYVDHYGKTPTSNSINHSKINKKAIVISVVIIVAIIVIIAIVLIVIFALKKFKINKIADYSIHEAANSDNSTLAELLFGNEEKQKISQSLNIDEYI